MHSQYVLVVGFDVVRGLSHRLSPMVMQLFGTTFNLTTDATSRCYSSEERNKSIDLFKQKEKNRRDNKYIAILRIDLFDLMCATPSV
jgi:hypothetical protein